MGLRSGLIRLDMISPHGASIGWLTAKNLLWIVVQGLAFFGAHGEEMLDNYKMYGLAMTILINIIFPKAGRTIYRVKHHLLGHNEAGIQLFTKSFAESFTMIGVAGAIIAQIAITGLSLDKLDQTHWTAYAAFIVSVIAGCLSVYYSCTTQQALSSLHGSQETLEWLTTSKTPSISSRAQRHRFNSPEFLQSRNQSISAALLLVAPSQLLTMSLIAFLIGQGIYLGVLFGNRLSVIDGKRSPLRVLVTYIVVTAVLVLFYGFAFVVKTGDHWLLTRNKDGEEIELRNMEESGEGPPKRPTVVREYEEMVNVRCPCRRPEADEDEIVPEIPRHTDRFEAALETLVRMQAEQLDMQNKLLRAMKDFVQRGDQGMPAG